MIMKAVLPMALLLALSVPAFAQGTIGDISPSTMGVKPPSGGGGKPVKGAPGPLMGAGLSTLLIAGGIYWVVRRRKQRS
jgi:hypothetical protein